MVRRTFIIIAFLWLIVLLVVAYLYLTGHFIQYMSTVPKESTASSSAIALSLTSSAIESDGLIPAQYTCDAKQISPPLSIRNAPEKTRSFVLILEDRDVPKNLSPNGTFLHWSVFNIPAFTQEIGIGEIVGTLGASGNGVAGYVGPCPPTQYEPKEHRYYFDLYALDTVLTISEGGDMSAVRSAMQGHVLQHATLIGRYQRTQ